MQKCTLLALLCKPVLLVYVKCALLRKENFTALIPTYLPEIF